MPTTEVVRKLIVFAWNMQCTHFESKRAAVTQNCQRQRCMKGSLEDGELMTATAAELSQATNL